MLLLTWEGGCSLREVLPLARQHGHYTAFRHTLAHDDKGLAQLPVIDAQRGADAVLIALQGSDNIVLVGSRPLGLGVHDPGDAREVARQLRPLGERGVVRPAAVL